LSGSFFSRYDWVEITKKEAGCESYQSDDDECYCGWQYEGEESVANNCTSSGAGDWQVWNCITAVDYETNGRCDSAFIFDCFNDGACTFAPLADPVTATPVNVVSSGAARLLGSVGGVSTLLVGIAASFAMLY
jgi:hypothetical protein